MGNASQCGFLSNTEQQFQFLREQNHFLYGQIKHIKRDIQQQEHIAIKRIKFDSSKRFEQYRQFINHYAEICQGLPLIRASQFKQQAQSKKINQNKSLETKQTQGPVFKCDKNNLFKSPTEQLSCAEPAQSLLIKIQYTQAKNSLAWIIQQKKDSLRKALQNNKVNQNILLELQNKTKLCDYQKIDQLPFKQRSVINLFWNEIQILRMLDYMVSALYGLKMYGVTKKSCVRAENFVKCGKEDELKYFCPRIVDQDEQGNFQRSFNVLKKWVEKEDAKFHHNWNIKERQLICYLHPDYLQLLAQSIVNSSSSNNFFDPTSFHMSKQQVQQQNIFALGLIILQLCLLQPRICPKLYHISTCKHQKTLKNEHKYTFEKEALTIKFNNNSVQKYLAEMKTRYSEKFTQLVEAMILGFSNSNKTKNDQKLTYQTVIQQLSELIVQNTTKLNIVHDPRRQKSNSRSKYCSKQNSRKSSLSRQVSASGMSDPSLSSNSSMSIIPVQSQQKVLSIELLKKNCKRLEGKADQALVKSQLQSLSENFAKKQGRLKDLIAKDEQRILSQLNKLNEDNRYIQKPTSRFNYRKSQINEQSRIKNPTQNHAQLLENINFKIESPSFSFDKTSKFDISHISNKSQNQSQEKRLNSTTHIKKIVLQKARQEEAMGESICQTVQINKSRNVSSQFQLNNQKSTIYGKSAQQSIIGSKSTQKQVQPFKEPLQNFVSKSDLKNLIAFKNKNTQKDNSKNQEKALKELKSKQLYQIYLKQYKNLSKAQINSNF